MTPAKHHLVSALAQGGARLWYCRDDGETFGAFVGGRVADQRMRVVLDGKWLDHISPSPVEGKGTET